MLHNGKTVKVVWGRDERKLQPYLPPAQIRLQFIQVDTLKDFERFKPIFQQITISNVLLATDAWKALSFYPAILRKAT